MTTETLLQERGTTHGSFVDNAYYGQTLRLLFRSSKGWTAANIYQQEALEYIAGKLSRILSGQPGHEDHWRDIQGYAELAITTRRDSYDDRQLARPYGSATDVSGIAMTDP